MTIILEMVKIMINFQTITCEQFLNDYWQKKAVVFRQAIADFSNPLEPDELAGLAMEEDIESRIVIQTDELPHWYLKRGPFSESDFAKLPTKQWTLLVQGVDRFVPEVADLLDHFNFIPAWRVDDVMISYAVEEGSVGPHYDNYDVFLYQAKGRRKWSLTTKSCTPENYLDNVELRIMKQFETEEEYILEEGDMLYLPPHVAHHGVSLSADCMTYSFGYRSYQSQELWDSLGDYLAEKKFPQALYKDPCFESVSGTNEIPENAWQNARDVLQNIINDKSAMQEWFGRLITSIDQHAETLLPVSDEDEIGLGDFEQYLFQSRYLRRNPVCRFAYYGEDKPIKLFVNGSVWDIDKISSELIKMVANQSMINTSDLQRFAALKPDMQFLRDLWQLQWLEFID